MSTVTNFSDATSEFEEWLNSVDQKEWVKYIVEHVFISVKSVSRYYLIFICFNFMFPTIVPWNFE